MDGKAYDGVVGANIFLYSSVPVDAKTGVNLLLETDGTGVSNSYNKFIDAILIGAGTNNEIDFANVDPNVNHIIHVGSADVIDSAWYYDGTTNWNVTGNFTSETYDHLIFENDNDVVYIGNTVNFTTIAVSLNRTASINLNFEYYYCDENEVWKALPEVIDTTAGFTVSGSISFVSPSDRGKCNTDMDKNNFDDTEKYHYIAINRTRNFVVTPPIENLFTISGGSIMVIFSRKVCLYRLFLYASTVSMVNSLEKMLVSLAP